MQTKSINIPSFDIKGIIEKVNSRKWLIKMRRMYQAIGTLMMIGCLIQIIEHQGNTVTNALGLALAALFFTFANKCATILLKKQIQEYLEDNAIVLGDSN